MQTMIPPTVTIIGKRLQVTARSLGIPFEEDFYWENGRFPRRIVTGIIIAAENEQAMREAISRRNSKRKSPAEKAAARRAKETKDAAALLQEILTRFPSMPEQEASRCAGHATELGSGRVGRSTVADDPAHAAVIAHIRHRHTHYDTILRDGTPKDEAREIVKPQILAILESWKNPIDPASAIA